MLFSLGLGLFIVCKRVIKGKLTTYLYKKYFNFEKFLPLLSIENYGAGPGGGGGALPIRPDGRSSRFKGLTKWLLNCTVSIIVQRLSLACVLLYIMNKILSFPNQQ